MNGKAEPNEHVYMDYAAASFLKDEVFLRMRPYLQERFGNPSGVYASARAARDALEDARAAIAGLIGARTEEVYFTSGGAEANNWALFGGMSAGAGGGKHLVTSGAEHHTVLEPCGELERRGRAVTYLSVDEYGGVDANRVEGALREDTGLVSVMTANNEVGTLNPIGAIAEITRKHGVPLHTDAVAAAGHVPLDVSCGVDLLSLSAHKFYGPKGTGCLYARKGVALSPLIFGGGQEKNRRAGTENVAGAVGMAAALELACGEMEKENERLRALRDGMEALLAERVPGARFFGNPKARLCNYVSVALPGLEARSALVALDRMGVECSAGSACSVGALSPSHVLLAMGVGEDQASCTLRFTLGARTTRTQVEYAARCVGELYRRREK